jgi:hypothetical protein
MMMADDFAKLLDTIGSNDLTQHADWIAIWHW